MVKVEYQLVAVPKYLTSSGTWFCLASPACYHILIILVRRDSDCLRAGRCGDRIPVGARLSTPVNTGPGPTQLPIQCVPGHSWG